MHITHLANELLLHVFRSTPDIPSLLALASTCKHFYTILSRAYLPTLYATASAQYGPLTDAIRIITHNSSQAAHIPRPLPPQSLALLKRIIEVGKVANSWAELYPSQKWRGDNAANRRLLSTEEMFRLRRACYRIWLYTLAFHTPTHTRTIRLSPPIVRTRALLLRPWLSAELAEILDLHAIFRHLLHSQICPSNGTVLQRHRERWPDDTVPLLITTGLGKARNQCDEWQQGADFNGTQYGSRAYNQKGAAVEGWGDDIVQYYVVEDMLKLDPKQLLYLFAGVTGQLGNDGAISCGVGGDTLLGAKGVVERFVAGLGEWFENNGDTLEETVGLVVGDRGGEFGGLKEAVEEGWEGVVRVEE